MQNLAFYRNEAQNPVAVLIDFDLATTGPVNRAADEERIGTVPFIAREHLLSPEQEYGLHHDLESLFYCAVWYGLGYETLEKYPCKKGQTDDILNEWHAGDYRTMGLAKGIFVSCASERWVFEHFVDKKFGEKCKLLWLKFKESTMALFFASDRYSTGTIVSHCPTHKLCGALPTKVTVPILLRTLGVDDVNDDCEDACCTHMYLQRVDSQS